MNTNHIYGSLDVYRHSLSFLEDDTILSENVDIGYENIRRAACFGLSAMLNGLNNGNNNKCDSHIIFLKCITEHWSAVFEMAKDSQCKEIYEFLVRHWRVSPRNDENESGDTIENMVEMCFGSKAHPDKIKELCSVLLRLYLAETLKITTGGFDYSWFISQYDDLGYKDEDNYARYHALISGLFYYIGILNPNGIVSDDVHVASLPSIMYFVIGKLDKGDENFFISSLKVAESIKYSEKEAEKSIKKLEEKNEKIHRDYLRRNIEIMALFVAIFALITVNVSAVGILDFTALGFVIMNLSLGLALVVVFSLVAISTTSERKYGMVVLCILTIIMVLALAVMVLLMNNSSRYVVHYGIDGGVSTEEIYDGYYSNLERSVDD